VTEHFPKSTLTATAWCAKCGRSTEHRVDGGKIGPCLDANHPALIPHAVIPKLDLPPECEAPGKGRSHGKDVKQGDLFKK
jgi:hypothetical protein